MFHVLTFFKILMLNGIFFIGSSSEKALILGLWNPSSFTTFTEIPTDLSSSFSNVSLYLGPSKQLITSLASDPNCAVVFAAINNVIYVYHNFSIWQNVSTKFSIQHHGKSAGFGQIAFDFVGSNLYWCDSIMNWIAMKPAYNFDNSNYKVVVYKDINQPEGLALDSEDRLIFFSDNEYNARIEKASLDGLNRGVIVHRGLKRVLSLTVDLENNKLYWADHGRQTLEGCDYDGNNRIMIRRSNGVSVTGLTYYQNVLHAISANAKMMFAVGVSSGSQMYSRSFLSAQPFAITAYDDESQKLFNDPCSTRNCPHICVNTNGGPQCLCFEGFFLNSHGDSCIEKSWIFERGFIVSNASTLAMHEVHSANGQSNAYKYKQFPNNTIASFAVDAYLGIIYFVDSGSKSLKRHDLRSQQISTLTWSPSGKDLAFDWITNRLGWIESSISSIVSFSVDSEITAAIYNNLQQPGYLTIDPYLGILYWISGISEKSIVRGSWTRDTPKVLISSANLHNPSSLHYDVTSHRIYWLDRSIIKSSTINGSDIRSHVITNGATKTFTYKDLLAWISGDKLYFVRKIAKTAQYVVKTLHNSMDAAVFDSTLQDTPDTCDILNGGCGEMCVREENGHRCECDVGLQLQQDQSCDSNVLLANFIAVTDYTHGRILQIDLNNGGIVKLPLSIDKPPGLAFDKSTMMLFYSDSSTNTITSTTLHGKRTLFLTTGFTHADRLAIDYSTGNLYYTAVGATISQSYIGVVHRFTSLRKTLMQNLDMPRDITLYSSKGFLFWTETGNIPVICRANMDGTSIMHIATKDIGWPNGLAVDFTSSLLYWTDGKKNCIESSDLNGGNRMILAMDSDAHLMDVVNHGPYLYYTAWNRQHITKLDKTTGLKVGFMSDHPELGRLDSLDIYADEFRDVSASCSDRNGLCSTFCFPTSTGKTCGCQDNVNLQSDQLTCEGVFRCPTLLNNLEVLDCIPYSGHSCGFKCKAGYRTSASNTTVSCDFTGQWIPSIDALCEGINYAPESSEADKGYPYAWLSTAGAIIVVIFGIFWLRKRHANTVRNKSFNPEHNSNTPNSVYSMYGNGGYLSPEEDLFTINDSMMSTEYDEPVISPYLTPQA